MCLYVLELLSFVRCYMVFSSTQDEPELLARLPEVRRLRELVEHSDWHQDDPLQQSLRLFRWVRCLPALLLEAIATPGTTLLTCVVEPSNGRRTVQELLAFVALIHDAGKAETFQRLPDSTTRCPGHEAVSARMAPAICARFGFTPAETRFVTDLVKAHGEPYALFKEVASWPIPKQQERMRRFEAEHADHLLPLLLLAWGDLVTSHLRTIRPQKYEAVLDFYRRWLQRAWPGAARGSEEPGVRQ
jgi:hypothetical protein